MAGVWLDHAEAKIIAYYPGACEIFYVRSPYSRRVRIPGQKSDTSVYEHLFASNNESRKHNRKMHELGIYYNILADKLTLFEDILLFGPTEAKDELHNILKKDKRFLHKTIQVKSAPQMTEAEMISYTKKFFTPLPAESNKNLRATT